MNDNDALAARHCSITNYYVPVVGNQYKQFDIRKIVILLLHGMV